MARLPRLETIIFETRQAVDDATLAALARLPQLRTLVIDVPVSHQMDKPLTQAGFTALAGSKSLERLYVGGWQAEAMAEYLPLARSALPGFDVRPSCKHVSSVPPDFFRVAPFLGLGDYWGCNFPASSQSATAAGAVSARSRWWRAHWRVRLSWVARRGWWPMQPCPVRRWPCRCWLSF